MFKPEFKERGLVRAVFVASIGRCGFVDATSRERAEESGCIWAVGRWYRDDDKKLCENLKRDFNILADAYSKIGGNDYSGGMYTYEYMKYKG